MKNVLLLTGRELSSYVRTPSGYLIAAIMLALQGIIFNIVSMSAEVDSSTQAVTAFFMAAGWTAIVTAVLFSMRLLAEERSTGTQTLLFTSPVREGEIVLGKYLASLVYITVVILLSFYLPSLIVMNGKVSWGHLAAGYGGVLLCAANWLAFGMFASSLVRHPFFAVLLTGFAAAVIEFGFGYGGRMVAVRVSDADITAWTDILVYFSSYWGHLHTSFREGLVKLSDVAFYVTAIYFWLLAATHVLKGQRWR